MTGSGGLLVALVLLAAPAPTPNQVAAPTVAPALAPGDERVRAELEPEELPEWTRFWTRQPADRQAAIARFAAANRPGETGEFVGQLLAQSDAAQDNFAVFAALMDEQQVRRFTARTSDMLGPDLRKSFFPYLEKVRAQTIHRVMFVDRDRPDVPLPPEGTDMENWIASHPELQFWWDMMSLLEPRPAISLGRLAPPGSTPFQAQIFKSGTSAAPLSPLEIRRETAIYGRPILPFQRHHHCGGALIGPRLVLTAAHCVTAPRLGPFLTNRRVRTGTQSLDEEGTSWRIAGAVRHSGHVRQKHDIALLLLAPDSETRPAPAGATRVIRLPGDRDPPLKRGEPLKVTGWGSSERVAVGGSKFRALDGDPKVAELGLLFGFVRSVGADACNENPNYAGANRVGRGQICGLGEQGVDACQGDSGGPLTRTLRGESVLVGLVSFGRGCGLVDTPGVYTDVAFYRSWIAGATKALKAGEVIDWPPAPRR